MVKRTKTHYTYADWQKDNPVEADIQLLINAAQSFALSQVPHIGGESGDPEDPPERFAQPHWHTAFRLPSFLSHERFLSAFESARKRTRRLGYESDLQAFYDDYWIEYCLKTGPDSFCPQFLRAGTQ